jgi:hypothetical protein
MQPVIPKCCGLMQFVEYCIIFGSAFTEICFKFNMMIVLKLSSDVF